jgi:hypothetical protein
MILGPPRFQAAIKKLYLAFHESRLFPQCCQQCAVGNILDGNDQWKHLSDQHGSLELNYVGHVHQMLGRRFNGYTPLELLQIEQRFLKACGYQVPLHYQNTNILQPDTDTLFNGLSAVITYLCKLDGISNIMEYQQLFAETPLKDVEQPSMLC